MCSSDLIKTAVNIIMNGTQEELKDFIANFREEFNNFPFESVAFPRGVKGMKKYSDASQIYKKGTPIHVKGSLIFNNLLIKHKIRDIPPIQDGDKIKFTYLRVPNPIHDTVIATTDYIPIVFDLERYIDRDMQFEKAFLEPLKSITDVIGWGLEHKSTLEDFFG